MQTVQDLIATPAEAYRLGWRIGSHVVNFTTGAEPAIRWYGEKDGVRYFSGYHSREDVVRAIEKRIPEDRPVTARFVGGITRTVTQAIADSLAGLDADGNVVIDTEIGLVPLTPCCNATGTGTASGTACRACYAPVDPYYGGFATVAVAVAKGE